MKHQWPGSRRGSRQLALPRQCAQPRRAVARNRGPTAALPPTTSCDRRAMRGCALTWSPKNFNGVPTAYCAAYEVCPTAGCGTCCGWWCVVREADGASERIFHTSQWHAEFTWILFQRRRRHTAHDGALPRTTTHPRLPDIININTSPKINFNSRSLHGHAACGGGPVHRGAGPPVPPTRSRLRQVAQPMARATQTFYSANRLGGCQLILQ